MPLYRTFSGTLENKGPKWKAVLGHYRKLPTDHIESSAAATPRDALRSFSFHWQLKADEIMATKPVEKTQAQFANLLINRAHGLYDLFAKEELWASEA